MNVDPKYVDFFHCAMARPQQEGSVAAKIEFKDRRMVSRDPAEVEREEQMDLALAERLTVLPGQYYPPSSGVIIACSFEFEGTLYSLSVPIEPPGGFKAPEKEIPVLHITAKEANTLGSMLRDLAWSHAESQHILREKANEKP